jgi:hypothetical protein
MEFTERIEQGEATTYIDLLIPERKMYKGAGWCLVAIENGRIIDLTGIDDGMTVSEIDSCFTGNVNLARQGERLLQWCGEREVYLGMMSCYQFCSPQRFTPASLAKVARLIVDQITQ